jgi:hypothetical protein
MAVGVTSQRVVAANTAVSLLAVTVGIAAAPYDLRPAMLFGAALLGWSQLVGL